MRMTVQFQNGDRADAVLLAAQADRVRVVVAGRGVTEEWVLFYGHFYDQAGRPVEIDSIEAVEGVSYAFPEAVAVGSAAN